MVSPGSGTAGLHCSLRLVVGNSTIYAGMTDFQNVDQVTHGGFVSALDVPSGGLVAIYCDVFHATDVTTTTTTWQLSAARVSSVTFQ